MRLFIFSKLVLVNLTLAGITAGAQTVGRGELYYGKSREDLQQMSQQDLRKYLGEVLSKCHVSAKSDFDKIQNNCDKNSGGTCYRHKPLSYDGARTELLGNLHLEQLNNGYAIRDVYCNDELTARDFPAGKGPGPKKIPDANVVNTEHTWPQSHFDEQQKGFQKSDLHSLFPTSQDSNSLRGNHPFGEVKVVASQSCPESKLGYKDQQSNEIIFEPPNEHKGNVARAIFYFSVRYNRDVTPNEEAVLRKWHQQDPLDEQEIQRNEDIFDIQGTRNPFIDHPELVSKISNF